MFQVTTKQHKTNSFSTENIFCRKHLTQKLTGPKYAQTTSKLDYLNELS